MNIINILKKIIFLVFGLSYILHFGSELILTQLAYSIFDIDLLGNLTLEVNDIEAFITIKNFAMLSIYKFIFILSSIIFGGIWFFISDISLKKSTYDFIIFIFITISIITILPIYFIEVRLSMAIFMDGVNQFNDGSINAFFIERFKSPLYSILSGFSFLATITSISTYLIKDRNRNLKN
jgi:hypothetical protein